MSLGQRKRAVVVGGSIGGLFAGLFLRKVGWDVSIHERAGEELGSRGAGVATHDELHEALALATEPGGEIGVAVGGRIVLARTGDVICEVARPQVLASWDRIWRAPTSRGRRCLPPWQRTDIGRAGRATRLRAFRRRQRSCCRPFGRRRRHPIHGAATIDACHRATLCRLCGVAWAGGHGRPVWGSPRSAAQPVRFLPAGPRTGAWLSGRRRPGLGGPL